MRMDGMGPCGHSMRNGVSPLNLLGPVPAAQADALRAMVRGERPVEDLNTAGVALALRRIDGTIPPMLGAADLAEGILNLKDDPVALAEWASFILVLSEFFALDAAPADCGDRLLSSIWDIAFGAPPAGPVIRLAKAIRNRRHGI